MPRHGRQKKLPHHLSEFVMDSCDMDQAFSLNHKNHKKQLTGEESFHCGICGLGLESTSISKLSNHIKVHKTEKLYKCDVCEKSFSRANHFNAHMRKHTEGKIPFHCGVCGLGFDMTKKLSDHIKIHKTAKPYECDVCEKNFSTADVFKAHIRSRCYIVTMSERPVKRARTDVSLDMKHKIIGDYEKLPRPTQKELAMKFGLGRTTIGDILKRKEEIKQMIANNINSNKKRVYKNSKFEKLNRMTHDWFVAARSKNIPLSGPIIKTKALVFADDMNISDFKASDGWLTSWKWRYNIKAFKEKV